MSINALEPGWWGKPLHKHEKIWIIIAVIWCLLITIAMPYWHLVGAQNASQEYYKITVDDFETLTEAFVAKYTIGEENGVPVVEAPPGSDIFLLGRQWEWYPILHLRKGKEYRLHLSSVDVLHSMSIYPINMNFEAVPGWDMVLTITPTSIHDFRIICNEFCGIGHHAMIGKIIVEE